MAPWKSRAGKRKPWLKRNMRKRVIRKRTGIKQPVQYFKRTLYAKGYKVSSTTADTFLSFPASLGQVPNSSEFVALYDQYKICGIKWTLMPRTTEAGVTTNSGVVGSVIDYDDSNVPTATDQLAQYQNFRMTRGNMIHKRYFKPAISQLMYQSGVINAYGPKKGAWIDITYPDVPHYGLKAVIQQTDSVLTYDLKVDYYLAFKNVR